MTAIDNMRRAGRINLEALRVGLSECKPGNTLRYIDGVIRGTIEYNGGHPAFLNYQPQGASTPYPASSCISVNDVAVHGVPNDYALQDGDIVTIDVGTEYNGRFADAARTIIVGTLSQKRLTLMQATNAILLTQLSVVREGCTLMDIALASEEEAAQLGVTIMPEWGGHGIGPGLHMPPFIPSTLDKRQTRLKQQIDGNQYRRYKLKEGETICLEPVVSFGPQVIMIDEDGWTVRTKSGEDVAHVEHCLMVTKTGYEIFS